MKSKLLRTAYLNWSLTASPVSSPASPSHATLCNLAIPWAHQARFQLRTLTHSSTSFQDSFHHFIWLCLYVSSSKCLPSSRRHTAHKNAHTHTVFLKHHGTNRNGFHTSWMHTWAEGEQKEWFSGVTGFGVVFISSFYFYTPSIY